MKKQILLLVYSLMFIPALFSQALDYEKPAHYIIGDIRVEGANHSDVNAIISYSGLRKDDQISVPGQEIADAIKGSSFKRKDVTTQAIHNELIKDKRFVLIGRGIYALKEPYQDDWDSYLNDNIFDGIVEIWGKIIVAENGYRAEYGDHALYPARSRGRFRLFHLE